MRCQILAECSTNWGGSLSWANDFIAACADAGADLVKFQSYQIKHLRRDDPQYEWFKQCELSDSDHGVLMEACAKHDVKFLTTVFHAERVPFLKSLGLDTIKIGSGEARNQELVTACAVAFDTVIASYGLFEMEDADRRIWPRPSVFLQSVSKYPTLLDDVTLQMQFYDGWSDHCIGIDVAKAAIAMGAQYLEKHVTLPYAPRQCAWDATMQQIRELRDYAEFIERITTGTAPDLTEARQRFIGRWQATEAVSV